MPNLLVFDIETSPRSRRELANLCPAFDPESVRLGNLKDPQKIEAKIAKARADHFGNFTKRAALDPLYGQVLCIGYHRPLAPTPDDEPIVDWVETTRDGRDEAEVIECFWNWAMAPDTICIGHNIRQFDLPFLLNRSFVLGIKPPAAWHAFLTSPAGFFNSGRWLDTSWIWRGALNSYDGRWSLDAICHGCEIGRKEDFDGLLAFELCENGRFQDAARIVLGDLKLTWQLARRMGIENAARCTS